MIRLRCLSPNIAPAVLAACAGLSAAAAVAAAPSATSPPTTAAPAKSAIGPDAGSYDVGLLLGGQLEHSGLAPGLSMDNLVRGIKDALAGHAMSAEERDAAQRYMHDAREALADKNRNAGREFLERNAKEPGVVAMPSGLQYRVLAAGDPGGKSPSPADQVTVRYRASLADGSEIDRSDAHDRPATFRVNSVFKGWQEAFVAMKPGAKWQLFVPAELSYGANPPPMVPPGALLVYEIELLRVDPTPPMDPGAARHPGAVAVKPGATGAAAPKP